MKTSDHHFWHDLEAFGARPALVDENGATVSYAELARRADRFGESLHVVADRGLLLLEMRNRAAAVAAYLGALRAGWPVILSTEVAGAKAQDLLARFGPDLVWREETGLVAGPALAGGLADDLAVMLSTSGSTGSAKLVCLSHTNIHENARSIADYLDITDDRIAATTLPMHYSYGLSVLNSFLLKGARLVLTEASVIDPGFRAMIEREGVTDLAGVPYLYELLERVGFRDAPPPSLRVMTQAGGRLAPELVRKYAECARDHGFRFFVMYGQTEATARMAYLPPELAIAHADCMGVPIPRGRFDLLAEDGTPVTGPGVAGELVYHGPNVMMGYGLTRADLALGARLDMLRTGDIAERTADGLYRIVGRMSRFSKIAGLRISFDEVEGILRRAGIESIVTGDDQAVLLAVRDGDPADARQRIAEACGIPATTVFAWPLPELPVLPSGKADYQTIRKEGAALAEAGRKAAASDHKSSVAALYAREMNRARPAPDDSFSGLGGDSLAYVNVSIGIEELVGQVPDGWEAMPVAQLQALADAFHATEGGARPRRLTLGPDVLMRLLAISLIVIGHGAPSETEWLRGGSGILFFLAGFSMAMIHLPQFISGRVLPMIRSTSVTLVLPYLLMVALFVLVLRPFENGPPAISLSWFTLTSVFLLPEYAPRGPIYSYWFMETLFHLMLFACALFLVPPFRRLVGRWPFAVMVGLVVLATPLRWAGARWWPTGIEAGLTFDAWAWIFFLGWAAFFARMPWQKLLVLALALGLGFDQFALVPSRALWLTVGVAFVLFVPPMRVHWRLARGVAYTAGATYFIYLMHPFVLWGAMFELGGIYAFGPAVTILLVYFGSMALGIVSKEGWRQVLLLPRRGRPHRRSA